MPNTYLRGGGKIALLLIGMMWYETHPEPMQKIGNGHHHHRDVRTSPSHSLGRCGIELFLNQYATDHHFNLLIGGRSPPHSIKIVLDDSLSKPITKCRNDRHPKLIKGERIANPLLKILWDGTHPKQIKTG